MTTNARLVGAVMPKSAQVKSPLTSTSKRSGSSRDSISNSISASVPFTFTVAMTVDVNDSPSANHSGMSGNSWILMVALVDSGTADLVCIDHVERRRS